MARLQLQHNVWHACLPMATALDVPCNSYTSIVLWQRALAAGFGRDRPVPLRASKPPLCTPLTPAAHLLAKVEGAGARDDGNGDCSPLHSPLALFPQDVLLLFRRHAAAMQGRALPSCCCCRRAARNPFWALVEVVAWLEPPMTSL